MTEPEQPDRPPEPPGTPDEEEPRRYPSTVGGALYILVLLATAGGIVVVDRTDDWRLGVRIVAGALLAAAACRLLLRQRDAGMLAVRHRLVDVLLLSAVGVVLFFLAGDIPDQPGT